MRIQRIFNTIDRRMWNASVRLAMLKDRHRDLDPYVRRVHALHRRLHVPIDYDRRGLRFHYEVADLVAVPCGPNGVDRLMASAIQSPWLAMQAAARSNGLAFFVKGAFRSADRQTSLIRQQLSRGKTIDQLLNWIAAPGYSEHHTGRALDLGCASHDDKDFDKAPIFHWLRENAEEFGFKLSFPKNNPFGIKYEPWHWYCAPDKLTDGNR